MNRSFWSNIGSLMDLFPKTNFRKYIKKTKNNTMQSEADIHVYCVQCGENIVVRVKMQDGQVDDSALTRILAKAGWGVYPWGTLCLDCEKKQTGLI